MIERLVIEAPAGHELSVSDLTIAGVPLRFGGQVAECITVKLVGIANIVASPVKNPAVPTNRRAGIDPGNPRTVDRSSPLSEPLEPGEVEAFRLEGALPAGSTSASSRMRQSKVSAKHHTRHFPRSR